MAIAATTELIEGVKIATSKMASTKEGMVWKNSVKRITRSSTSPPQYPATAPSVTPTESAATVETAPTISEIRAPWAMPAATSRPRLSLPNNIPISPGGMKGAPAISQGLPGKSSGAVAATSSTSSSPASPTTAPLLRR